LAIAATRAPFSAESSPSTPAASPSLTGDFPHGSPCTANDRISRTMRKTATSMLCAANRRFARMVGASVPVLRAWGSVMGLRGSPTRFAPPGNVGRASASRGAAEGTSPVRQGGEGRPPQPPCPRRIGEGPKGRHPFVPRVVKSAGPSDLPGPWRNSLPALTDRAISFRPSGPARFGCLHRIGRGVEKRHPYFFGCGRRPRQDYRDQFV
jgi:hypothetical protein